MLRVPWGSIDSLGSGFLRSLLQRFIHFFEPLSRFPIQRSRQERDKYSVEFFAMNEAGLIRSQGLDFECVLVVKEAWNQHVAEPADFLLRLEFHNSGTKCRGPTSGWLDLHVEF